MQRAIEKAPISPKSTDGPVTRAVFDKLDELLRRQSYRLASGGSRPRKLIMVGFFDVERTGRNPDGIPEVFDATHQLVLELVRPERWLGSIVRTCRGNI